MLNTSVTDPLIEIISDHLFVKVILNNLTRQKSLQSSAHFQPGDMICPFAAKTTERYPNYLTVQIGEEQHITLSPEFLQYTNHSCDPNVFFETGAMQLICLQPIQPGDELTYFYPSTEWEMDQAFDCNCGSVSCLQVIRGAAYLPSGVRERYRFSEYISLKMKELV